MFIGIQEFWHLNIWNLILLKNARHATKEENMTLMKRKTLPVEIYIKSAPERSLNNIPLYPTSEKTHQ